MSRTFPRASFRGCFLFVCCCSLVIFTYTGHDVHRRGHGRRRPLRGLSVGFSRRHRRDACSAAWRCGPSSAVVLRRRRVYAWRVILVKLQASRRRRRRGYVYLTRAPSPRQRISAGRARPGAARAPRPAFIPKQYKAGRRKGRTKFEATTDATDAPRARPCSSWPSSFARSRRTRRPRPAAARVDRTRRRAR